MRGLISEDRAIDALLTAAVDELPPAKEGIGISGAKDNLFPRPHEQGSHPSIAVTIGRIVTLVEFEAIPIAVLCEPPKRFNYATSFFCRRLRGVLKSSRSVCERDTDIPLEAIR